MDAAVFSFSTWAASFRLFSAVCCSAPAVCVPFPKELLFCAFGCFGDHVVDAAVGTGRGAAFAVLAAAEEANVDRHHFDLLFCRPRQIASPSSPQPLPLPPGKEIRFCPERLRRSQSLHSRTLPFGQLPRKLVHRPLCTPLFPASQRLRSVPRFAEASPPRPPPGLRPPSARFLFAESESGYLAHSCSFPPFILRTSADWSRRWP